MWSAPNPFPQIVGSQFEEQLDCHRKHVHVVGGVWEPRPEGGQGEVEDGFILLGGWVHFQQPVEDLHYIEGLPL